MENEKMLKRHQLLQNKLRQFGFITQNAALLNQLEMMERIVPTDISVLITGESGTGKNILAEYIHKNSPRKNNNFITLDVGCLSPQIIESELFGHVKGSFTSAVSDHKGAFERAQNGTIFLDEITELDLNLQKKLLRVLEDKVIRRLGGEREIRLDLRIITATNKDIRQLVKSGKFRQDLYYRLNETTVHLPPLRERPEDIGPICQFFLDIYNKQYAKKISSVSTAAMSLMQDYSWPGNIRELRNVIKSATALSKREVLWIEDLNIFSKSTADTNPQFNGIKPLDTLEKEYLLYALKIFDGNKTKTAQALDISRPRLQRILERHKIAE
jgi:transcriptional regulator with PAS, ATPase and Fis domain